MDTKQDPTPKGTWNYIFIVPIVVTALVVVLSLCDITW